MNSTPPEANNEYSRAPRASRGDLPPGRRADSRALEVHGDGVSSVISVGALVAAAVLIAAEFTTLYSVHVIGRVRPAGSVATGSHHGYALIPVALLVVILSLAVRRGAGRPTLLALGALAVIALVIALLVDLPAAHRTGLVAAGGHFDVGTARPAVGFYLETLGAILLLIVAGVGMLAGAGEAGGQPRRERGPRSGLD
jgi:hypothetical protein